MSHNYSLNRSSRSRTNLSPTFTPSSPTNQSQDRAPHEEEDFDEELEDATELAFESIFANSTKTSFVVELQDLAPVDLFQTEDINEILSLITQHVSENPTVDIFDPQQDNFRTKSLEKSSQTFNQMDSNDQEIYLDKFIPYNELLENDHSFQDENLLRMFSNNFKEEVRQLIINGEISADFIKVDKECQFLKTEIYRIISKNISSDISISKALKLLENNKNVILEVFNSGLKKFLTFKETYHHFPKKMYSEIKDPDLLDLLRFNEKKFAAIYRLVDNLRIVYIPSGGGKTTLSNHPIFHDVDDIVKDNFVLFEKIEKFCSKKFSKFKPYFMTLFFKQCIINLDPEILTSKVLLLNHPNQVPNCFKIRTNELIIIPTKWNFKIRYFSENLFSLLHCNRYVRKFVKYQDYFEVIRQYFSF